MIISVRINVLLTYYVNDLFTALQIAFSQGAGRSSGIAGFRGNPSPPYGEI